MLIGKYSIVAFKDQTLHKGGYYVQDIQNGLLKLCGFERMVDENEVKKLSHEDISTEELVSIHNQISIIEGVLMSEIRRRATMNRKLKLQSPYFFDHFEIKKKIGK